MNRQTLLRIGIVIIFSHSFRCIDEKNWDLLYLLKKEADISLTNEFTILLKSNTDYSRMFLSAKTLFPSNAVPQRFVILLKIKFLNRIKSPGTIFSITDPNNEHRLSLTVNTSPGIIDKVTLNIIFHPVDEEKIIRDVILPFTKQTIWTLGISIIDDKIVFYTSCEDIKRPFGYQFIIIKHKLERIFFRDGAIISIFNDRDGSRKLRGEVFELSFANYEGKLQFLCSKSMIEGSGKQKPKKNEEKLGNVLLLPEKVNQPEIDDDLDKVFFEEVATAEVNKSTSNDYFVTKIGKTRTQRQPGSSTNIKIVTSSRKGPKVSTTIVSDKVTIPLDSTISMENISPLLPLKMHDKVSSPSSKTKINYSPETIMISEHHRVIINGRNDSLTSNQSKHQNNYTIKSREKSMNFTNSGVETTIANELDEIEMKSLVKDVTNNAETNVEMRISKRTMKSEDIVTRFITEMQKEKIDTTTIKSTTEDRKLETSVNYGGEQTISIRNTTPNRLLDSKTTKNYTALTTSITTEGRTATKNYETTRTLEDGGLEDNDKIDNDPFFEIDELVSTNANSKLFTTQTKEVTHSTGQTKADMTVSRIDGEINELRHTTKDMKRRDLTFLEDDVRKSSNFIKKSTTLKDDLSSLNENSWANNNEEISKIPANNVEIYTRITTEIPTDSTTKLVIEDKRGKTSNGYGLEQTIPASTPTSYKLLDPSTTLDNTILATDVIENKTVTQDIVPTRAVEVATLEDNEKLDSDPFFDLDEQVSTNTHSNKYTNQTKEAIKLTESWKTSKEIEKTSLPLLEYKVTKGIPANKNITTLKNDVSSLNVNNQTRDLGKKQTGETELGFTSQTQSRDITSMPTLYERRCITSTKIPDQSLDSSPTVIAKLTSTDTKSTDTISTDAISTDTRSLEKDSQLEAKNKNDNDPFFEFPEVTRTNAQLTDLSKQNISTKIEIHKNNTEDKFKDDESRDVNVSKYPTSTARPHVYGITTRLSITGSHHSDVTEQTTEKETLTTINQCQIYIDRLEKLESCKELRKLMATTRVIGTKGEKGFPGEKGNIGPSGDQGKCERSMCHSGNFKNSIKGVKGDRGQCRNEKCFSVKGEKGEKGFAGIMGDKGERGDSEPPNGDQIKLVLSQILVAEKDNIFKSIKGSKGDQCYKKCDIPTSENRENAKGTEFDTNKKIGYGSLIFDNREALEKIAFDLPIGSMALLLKSDTILIKIDLLNNIWRSLSLDTRSKDWNLPSPRQVQKLNPRVDPYEKRQTKILYLVALPISTTGDLKSTVYQPGGYNGAAFQCQQNGDIYGYGRSMRPLISTNVTSLKYIIGSKNQNIPIYNSRGERLSDNYQSLLSSTDDIQNEILDFDRRPIRDNTITSCVWIGNDNLPQSGDNQTNEQLRCNNWMTRDSHTEGLVSILSQPLKSIMSEDTVNRRSCSLHCHILCIQTQLHIQ